MTQTTSESLTLGAQILGCCCDLPCPPARHVDSALRRHPELSGEIILAAIDQFLEQPHALKLLVTQIAATLDQIHRAEFSH
jgi:hypothetical protein